MNPIIIIRGNSRIREILEDEFANFFPQAAVEDYIDQLEIGGEIFERPKTKALRTPSKGPFLWITHNGDLLDPREMPTPHLYYALRMIFNHSVPKRFRTPESIRPIKKYADVPKWSLAYRKAAVNALSAELATRNPKGLDQSMHDGLRWMKMATRAMLAEGL